MVSKPLPRDSHPHHMHDCIHDQPKAISEVLESQAKPARDLAGKISAAERVHIVGVGTSWHASLVGEYLLRQIGKRDDARAWNAFEFSAYPPALTAQDVVIVMSHTGTKEVSRQTLALAKEAKAVTGLVTSQVSQAKMEQADVVLRTSYRDRSSAFTISHTTAMTALAMVAVEVGGKNASQEATNLHQLPDAVQQALKQEGQVKDLVKTFAENRWYCFAGWGPNASTAYEVALKINEAAYDVTTAFQLEQFLHGPFVATTSGCLVTLVAPPGPGYERALEIARAVKETGAKVAALVQEGDEDMVKIADGSLALPEVPEFLTPIVYLVPLQLFTYWLALERGRNPDVFRLNDPRHQTARKHYAL